MSKQIPITAIQSFTVFGKKIGLSILTKESLEPEIVFTFEGFERVRFKVMVSQGSQGNGVYGFFVENYIKTDKADFADFVAAVKMQQARRDTVIILTDLRKSLERSNSEAAAMAEKFKELEKLFGKI